MKRRTSDLPILVFSYGCRPPTQNAPLVEEQLRLARKYRNKLIELELKRREAYRGIMRTHGDLQQIESDIEESDARLEELRMHIKAARKDARSRVAQPAAADQAKQLRERLKALRADAKKIRAAVREDPVIQARLDELDASSLDEAKKARAACGVYWGSYLDVERAMDAARKSKTDPRFGRWNGEGKLAVQIQGGATVDAIMHGRCSLLRIDPLPATQWDTRSGRRAAKTTVHIRVSSDEKGHPVWASFPVLLHRPMPPEGIVKNAWVVRRYTARKAVWALQLTVEADALRRPRLPDSAPIAALNVGWRVRPDGLRVGTLVDEFGGATEMIVPQSFFDRLEHSDSLRAIRDRNLDAFRPRLTEALKALQASNAGLPPWIDPEDLKTMHLWRSAERFARFVIKWKEARKSAMELAGFSPSAVTHTLDQDAFVDAEAWRKQDLHLLQWQDHERDRAFGYRKQIYRSVAASLSTQYRLIVMDTFDLRKVARKPAPEANADDQVAAQRRNRQRAAVSLLRMAIKHRVPTVEIPATHYTKCCNDCGSLEQFDAALHLVHTCSACGATWDQDVNHAKNLLRAYRERPPEAGSLDDNDSEQLSGA